MTNVDLRKIVCILAVGALAACETESAPDLMGATLSGRPFPELLPSDSAVVLVYDPATALSCASAWERWATWARTTGIPVRLVLTRKSNEDDSRVLRIRRVHPWLVAPAFAGLYGEYLVYGGRVLRKGSVPASYGVTSELLNDLGVS